MELIENNIDNLKDLCDTHYVDKMYLFGSALGSKYTHESDIDFLVKFKPLDLAKYFDNYVNLKEGLEDLLKKDIDLVEEQTLRNPILIYSINRSKKLVYG